GDRIGRIELRVREAWRRSYLRELVTGHAGCGKSTELLRLVAELRKPKQGKAFHVVYLDAYDYLNPHEVRLPQILMALLVALSEEPRWDLKQTRTAPVLWDRVRKILGSLGREVSKDLADAAGLPLLRALFRVDLKLARGFRKSSEDHIQELLTLMRDLITEVAAQLPPEIGDVVFVVDNLEKLPERETEGGASLHETLFGRELPLLDLPAHLILTYPIALNYSSVGLRQLFANARQTTMPMVSVRAKPEVTPRGDDPQGIAALRRLLGRRVALEAVFADDEAIVEAVRLSGGCVRDLLRIVGDLPSYGAQPYTRVLVGGVAADLINDYERLLQGKPYLGLLHEIARSGEFPAATTDEWKRQLLMNLIVLEYDTGTWYDVHPLVKATRAFRSAASAP
ncbi:MAG TPA: hypothetical protein VF469_30570, partial [Kofleriaceae bacterium]